MKIFGCNKEHHEVMEKLEEEILLLRKIVSINQDIFNMLLNYIIYGEKPKVR